MQRAIRPQILALISFKIIINLSKRRDNGTPRSREFRSSRDPTYASHLFFRPGCASTPSHGVCFPLESWFRGAYFRLSELTRTPQGPSLPNPGRAPVRVSHDSRAKDPAAEFTRDPHAVACFATRPRSVAPLRRPGLEESTAPDRRTMLCPGVRAALPARICTTVASRWPILYPPLMSLWPHGRRKYIWAQNRFGKFVFHRSTSCASGGGEEESAPGGKALTKVIEVQVSLGTVPQPPRLDAYLSVNTPEISHPAESYRASRMVWSR